MRELHVTFAVRCIVVFERTLLEAQYAVQFVYFISFVNNLSLHIFQGSRRVLRSNEISLPPSGLIDTEVDLSFSLQVSVM
jgi:hypothetical protein